MIKKTITKIEQTIEKIDSIDHQDKKELVRLLSKLKSEIETLPEKHLEHAHSIAGFTEIAAHEATRKDKDPDLIKLSMEGLSSSVKSFEVSHPKLVGIISELSMILARIGI